jgi:hypothetical protein
MSGAELIAKERERQIAKEGYSPEHDDEHDDGSLAWAAVCYAAPRRVYVRQDYAASVSFDDPWPWSPYDDKRPHNGNVVLDTRSEAARRRLLVKAGALIAAEIDRLQRAALREKPLPAQPSETRDAPKEETHDAE